MVRRLITLALFFVLVFAGGADAGKPKIDMLDGAGISHGKATVALAKGSAKLKVDLAPVPAMVDTGDGVFEATLYRAYLVNSTDPALEVSLGGVYPTTKGKAKVKAALKGDLSLLGLDRIVIVAFSKDGLSSFDVLTGTIEAQ